MTREGQGQLLSILGLGFGLAGAVGGTIGAGILRTPGLVAAQLGSPGLILVAWGVGGLYALLGAVGVAELAASLPQAGGWWVYAERAFGRRVGLMVGWTDWLAHAIGLAWVATTAGDYAQALLPAEPGPWLSRGIALAAIGLFGLIQWRGVRAGSASQELLSLAKAVAFLALVVACFALPLPGAGAGAGAMETAIETAFETAIETAEAQGPTAAGVVLALQAVITTYDGWASPVYFAEEFEQPGRDLPRSLIGGVLAVLVLYLLINLALLHVLPTTALAASTLPAADAARTLVGAAGAHAITAVALLALLGLINTVVMAAPRILFGLARRGLFPAWAAGVNAGGTPAPALLLTTAAAAVLVLTGNFERLLAMGAVLYVALPLAGMASLLALRQQEPDLPRPFRCWGYPLTPVLIAAGSLTFLVAGATAAPFSSLAAAGLVAVAYPASLLAERQGWLQ